MRQWFRSGTPWIWLTAAAVSASLIMVIGLVSLIAIRGLGYFWPGEVLDIQYRDADHHTVRIIGERYDEERVSASRLRESGVDLTTNAEQIERYLIKTGNRDVGGLDFRWLIEPDITTIERPGDVAVIERREWGNLYGFLIALKQGGQVVAEGDQAWPALAQRLDRARDLFAQIRAVQKEAMGEVNHGLEKLRLRERMLEIRGENDPERRLEIVAQRQELAARYADLEQRLVGLSEAIARDSIVVQTADGGIVEVPLAKTVRIFRPNSMGPTGKIAHYLEKLWEFVSDDPREANTEGGIFPAIFGTVLMVIIMSVIVTPFGVIAAVYLREYARQGVVTRLIRIAVNNLAGVPAIVYGVFGLGFFVYFVGGGIDQWMFPESLPAPTFGTPGILWASLTLAILTLPVVIVATEEGLARIPRSIREGSLALGATKAETLWRTVLPMASPAMMTGLILAVARAAGEVAPLMLVGVVKLAPSMPLDGDFPFLHLDRKFMHLGFHIYDVGFQSPNVEAARPLVYATALLLVLVILVLNLAAIAIRNRLREKYRSLES
ncbi:MAG: phosphate transport system permease protein [Gammaproteobacteria bacterium]|nr:MAG: phosphate transport system permease protein [Gammaproteobacteria bacterium]TND06622.1 MAG: phosphate transport system permease protein [Gammaproteobacteria bacterium]